MPRTRRTLEFTPELKHQIKVLNQRLWRLENTYNPYGTSYKKLSPSYRTIEQYATREPQSQNAAVSHGIYKINNDNGAIRFKSTKSEWDAMSEDERKKLVDIVENLWTNPDTSMFTSNINASYDSSYATFLSNRPELSEENLTREQYTEMWHIIDKLRQNANTHIGSDEINLMMSMYDVGYLLRTGQFEDAMNEMARGNARNIDRAARRRR